MPLGSMRSLAALEEEEAMTEGTTIPTQRRYFKHKKDGLQRVRKGSIHTQAQAARRGKVKGTSIIISTLTDMRRVALPPFQLRSLLHVCL